MKHIKLLSTLAVVSTAIVPFSTITSCSKNPYSSILEELKEATITELIELAKIPRRTGYTRKVCDYLKQQFTALGYSNITEDGYRGKGGNESSGNIWLDVPATAGYENKPKIALQGHMDMVLAGATDSDIQEAIKNGIQVERAVENGEEVIHSLHHKTSLGADDGIGVGMILALLKSDKVKHGPLRIIITSDEEGGMNGAVNLGKDIEGGALTALKDVDGLVNIDDELENEIIISSAGSERGYFTVDQFTLAQSMSNSTFEVNIDGLKGGHSGDYIHENRTNANKLAAEIMTTIDDGTLQLVSYDNKGLESPNVIVPSARFTFNSDESLANLENIMSLYQTQTKLLHPLDKDVTITIKEVDHATKSLTNADTKCIYDLMQKLLSGVYSMRTDKPNLTEASQNLSITSLNLDAVSPTKQFDLRTMARSSSTEKMSVIEWLNQTAYDSTLGTMQGHYEHDTPTHGWICKDDDKMFKYAKQGIELAGGTPNIVDTHSGIECSEFAFHKNDINLTSIGPTIDDVHSINETLHVKTLNTIITIVLNMLEHYE